MTTARKVIEIALRRSGIIDPSEAVEALEIQNGLTDLTAMLNDWVLDGVIKSFPTLTELTEVVLTFYDDTTLQDTTTVALSTNLAIRISGEAGVSVGQDVLFDAKNGLNAILRKQSNSQLLASSYETTLSNMPSQRLRRV